MQDKKQKAAEKVAEQPQPSHKEEPEQAPQAQQAPQEPEQKSEAASQPARPHKRGQGERYTDIPNSQVGVHPQQAALLLCVRHGRLYLTCAYCIGGSCLQWPRVALQICSQDIKWPRIDLHELVQCADQENHSQALVRVEA